MEAPAQDLDSVKLTNILDPCVEGDGACTYHVENDYRLNTAQTKAFLKFLPVILVLYLGFLTTFTMLARDYMTFKQVSWILVDVFFGYVSLDQDGSLLTLPRTDRATLVSYVA